MHKFNTFSESAPEDVSLKELTNLGKLLPFANYYYIEHNNKVFTNIVVPIEGNFEWKIHFKTNKENSLRIGLSTFKSSRNNKIEFPHFRFKNEKDYFFDFNQKKWIIKDAKTKINDYSDDEEEDLDLEFEDFIATLSIKNHIFTIEYGGKKVKTAIKENNRLVGLIVDYRDFPCNFDVKILSFKKIIPSLQSYLKDFKENILGDDGFKIDHTPELVEYDQDYLKEIKKWIKKKKKYNSESDYSDKDSDEYSDEYGGVDYDELMSYGSAKEYFDACF